MTPHFISKAAADFGIPVEQAIKTRIRYLLSLIDLWIAYIDEQANVMPESDMMSALDEIIRLRAYEGRLKRGISKDAITDEQIQAARDFPIEKIIEFDRTGKAYAFCHDDKKPSLTWFKKGNKARCFPCDKTFDTISVLQERDGLTFISAVRALN